MKKLLPLLLALLMALSLVACGGDAPVDEPTTGSVGSIDAADTATDDDTSGGEVTGGTDGFGDFAFILVPEEFEFQRDSWNEENPPLRFRQALRLCLLRFPQLHRRGGADEGI